MKTATGTLIPESVQAGTDNFNVVTTAGADVALTKPTRGLYFPAAITSLVIVNGDGTSVTIGAVPAGSTLWVSTAKILAATTSGAKIVVLY